MNNGIYVSINSKATEKILLEEKNHEFRNYIPKKEFDYLYVYVTYPVCLLKYIIHLNNILSVGELIKYNGDGNELFNDGKKTKFAYEIESVYELKSPIKLEDLKAKFSFTPPQSFAYSTSYPKLTNYILNQEKKLLWKNTKIFE
jgi:predicted transcriptional regulator